MTDNAPVLLVEGLSVRRGEQLAVEQVSFQLARETDTALVGPNGAGKSSLVAALLGLLPRAAGSVRILGHALGPAGELPRSCSMACCTASLRFVGLPSAVSPWMRAARSASVSESAVGSRIAVPTKPLEKGCSVTR